MSCGPVGDVYRVTVYGVTVRCRYCITGQEIHKLGQQHRQRPGRVRTTRPAATQHQTRVAPCAILSAHGLTTPRSPAQPRHAAVSDRVTTQKQDAATTPAPSTSRVDRSSTGCPFSPPLPRSTISRPPRPIAVLVVGLRAVRVSSGAAPADDAPSAYNCSAPRVEANSPTPAVGSALNGAD
jgi:hypothetical protein